MDRSPFPGMDPYLEGELWQEFHDRLANQISEQLLPLLQPKYVALLAKRYVMRQPPIVAIGGQPGLATFGLPPERVIYPDVHVVRRPEVKEVATLQYPGVAARPLELISPLPEEIPILSVEIRDVAGRRLVTVIEILSPVNKHGQGFGEYVDKRTELLRTRTHLLELDLLRGGQRIPLVGGELPPAPYFVFLSRANRRPITEIWPVGLRERLPTVPVPLLPPDPDVSLQVQAAVEACFALVGYQRLLDYAQPPPPPPLDPDDLAWVRAQVAALTG